LVGVYWKGFFILFTSRTGEFLYVDHRTIGLKVLCPERIFLLALLATVGEDGAYHPGKRSFLKGVFEQPLISL
jgi:hypothetical protein